jgi:hypothetical protein
MWPLCRGLYEKDQWKVGFKLAVRAADWPLLTGGRYSEVAVRTGLTVHVICILFFINLLSQWVALLAVAREVR